MKGKRLVIATSRLLAKSIEMASRKKVLLKVCLFQYGEARYLDSWLTLECQVIILGDSGVGKTSLMNQYVCAAATCLSWYRIGKCIYMGADRWDR